LCAPTVLHKTRSQVIQQHPMDRFLGADAKVTGCFYQPLAKMMKPNAVYINASGQWIIRTDNRASQFQPATAISEWKAITSAKHFQKPSRDFVSEIAGVTP